MSHKKNNRILHGGRKVMSCRKNNAISHGDYQAMSHTQKKGYCLVVVRQCHIEKITQYHVVAAK